MFGHDVLEHSELYHVVETLAHLMSGLHGIEMDYESPDEEIILDIWYWYLSIGEATKLFLVEMLQN